MSELTREQVAFRVPACIACGSIHLHATIGCVDEQGTCILFCDDCGAIRRSVDTPMPLLIAERKVSAWLAESAYKGWHLNDAILHTQQSEPDSIDAWLAAARTACETPEHRETPEPDPCRAPEVCTGDCSDCPTNPEVEE